MITYTYIVKCPECEDEFFDFFDEAKEFALSCMSKKPIITQTEVERNDFGECTDHCDLGTVWSWEDMMQDTESEDDRVFSKDETFGISEDLDDFDIGPQSDEFDSINNSVNFEIDEISDNFRKPIPEGMTIEQLVEEMEENEDEVECTWCNDLFDKSECRKEVDLGWLCSRCEAAIKSRGETLTFRENNYWDFLDEKLDLDIDFSQCIDSSDMEIWGVEPIAKNTYKAVLMKRFENVPFRGHGYRDEIEKVEAEMFELGGIFVFHFGKDGLPKLGRWDPELLNSLGTCEIIFDDERYDHACEETLNGSASKTEELEPEATHDLGNEYDGGYPAESTETDEVLDSHLKLCPECGKDTFDIETGICVECGFN